MTGFVLVDEIDLHLHPQWQLRVIDDLRSVFPRLSFVVTTHNPLTLHGARTGEVFVMRRRERQIELDQLDIPVGADANAILLNQFDVLHTFDRETRGLLGEHRELLKAGVAEQDPKRRRIEERLRERLGTLSQWAATRQRNPRA